PGRCALLAANAPITTQRPRTANCSQKPSHAQKACSAGPDLPPVSTIWWASPIPGRVQQCPRGGCCFNPAGEGCGTKTRRRLRQGRALLRGLDSGDGCRYLGRGPRYRREGKLVPLIRLRRSILFIPGANPRALEKARSLPADGLIFDLEDAVAP